MWILIHHRTCGMPAYKRSTKPELSTPLDEKDTFHLDGSDMKRTDRLICESCQEPLWLSDIHPKYWKEE